MKCSLLHYVKSVQIRSFFWSVFSLFVLNTQIYSIYLHIQSEYWKIWSRKKLRILDNFHTVLNFKYVPSKHSP